MIEIQFYEFPDKAQYTKQYEDCHGSNNYNAEFEKYFRCKLYYNNKIGWRAQFDDEEYTLFLLRWA